MFTIARTYINNIEILTKEMSVAAFTEAHFAFIQNTQREMIYNPNRTILSSNSFDVSRDYLLKIYDRVQLYLDLHQQNRNVHNSDYLDLFKAIMNENLCESAYIEQALMPETCATLFSDGPTHGLQTVVIMYFEQLRESLNTYQNLTVTAQQLQLAIGNSSKTNTTTTASNSTAANTTTATNTTNSSTNTTTKPGSTSTTKKNTTTTPTNTTTTSNATTTSSNSTQQQQNATSNSTNATTANSTRLAQVQKQLSGLLNTSQFKTLYWMQFRFLQDAFRILVKTLNTATNNDFENTINTKMALFIVFVIAVVLAYLIFWTPFVSKLNRDVSSSNRSGKMLCIDIADEDDVDDNPDPDHLEDTQDSRIPKQTDNGGRGHCRQRRCRTLTGQLHRGGRLSQGRTVSLNTTAHTRKVQ